MGQEEFKNTIIPYSRKLYPFIKRLLHNEGETEDAIQDLMLKLWNKRSELRTVQNMGAYITSMARNYCFDLLKKKKPQLVNENEDPKLKNLPTDEKSFETKEKFQQIQEIINNLPEKYKEVIQLRDLDGFSFEEIKTMTGYEVPYLRVILSRSRLKVKSELLKIYDYEKGTEKQLIRQIL